MSILKEAEDFNDIIIGDFYDTYENLPLKTYLGYQFYNDQCKVSQKYYVMELICFKSLRNYLFLLRYYFFSSVIIAFIIFSIS